MVKLKIVPYTMNSTMVDRAVQFVKKAWDAPRKFCLLRSPRSVIQPYWWFVPMNMQRQVSSQRLDRFVLLKREHTLSVVGPPL